MAIISSLKTLKNALVATAFFSLAPFSCSDPEQLGKVPYCAQQSCDEDKDGYCKELPDNTPVDYSLQQNCPNSFLETPTKFDCNDGNKNIFPGAIEYCNGYDDNCNLQADETDPILENPQTIKCGLEGGLDGKGECRMGAYACIGGTLLCEGSLAPTDEICDGLDNDCNNVVDDYLESVDCYYGWILDHGEPVLYQPPGGIDDPTINVGPCRLGYEILYCIDGEIASDNVCHNAVVPKSEICGNGVDDDCNGTVDDATCPSVDIPDVEIPDVEMPGAEIPLRPIDIVVVVDCNLGNVIKEALQEAFTNATIPGYEASPAVDIRFSTVHYTTDGPDWYTVEETNLWHFIWPKIMRAQVSAEEFQNNFSLDISGPCHEMDYDRATYGSKQYSLDPLFFVGCVLDGDENYDVCHVYHNYPILEEFYQRNGLLEFWREESEKYVILFADQNSDTYGLYNSAIEDPEQEILTWVRKINQANMADLLHGLRIMVDAHVPEVYHNLQTSTNTDRLDPMQQQAGYGWLVRDVEGRQISGLFDLVREVEEGTLQEILEMRIDEWSNGR